MRSIAFLVWFIALEKELFDCENPSYDDIQGVMIWMDSCDNLWQLRFSWGQILHNYL